MKNNPQMQILAKFSLFTKVVDYLQVGAENFFKLWVSAD